MSYIVHATARPSSLGKTDLEKFKEKVRQITTRSHNLDAEMVEKLNRVIRGTANYFTRPWSACCHMYRTLDRWIRMRLRCMKTKRG